MKKEEYNICGHKLISYKLSYNGFFDEMGRRKKKGQKQKKCDKCGLYLFKDELQTDPKNIGVMPN